MRNSNSDSEESKTQRKSHHEIFNESFIDDAPDRDQPEMIKNVG